jgi:hypothetical protein
MAITMTKQKSVIKFLSSGRYINQDRAYNMFGVRNLRATISDVKEQVERYGNWRIVRSKSRDGTSRYSMKRINLINPAGISVGGRKRSTSSKTSSNRKSK